MILYNTLFDKDGGYMFWDGDLTMIDDVVEKRRAVNEAEMWSYLSEHKYVKKGEVSVLSDEKTYGVFYFPYDMFFKDGVFKDKKIVIEIKKEGDEVKRELMDYIQRRAGEDEIDDFTYMVYSEVVKKLKWVKVDIRYRGYVVEDYVVVGVEDGVQKDDYETDLNMLLLKEWIDGYWNVTEFNFGKKYGQDVPIAIGKDYDVIYKGEEYRLYGMYTPQMRYAMLRNFYSKEQIEEAQKKGELRTLQSWQYRVLQEFGHVNVVAAVRRAGKSFLSAFIGIREILRERVGIKPIRVLYYGLTYDRTKVAINYLLGLTEDFRKLGIFKWQVADKMLVFKDPATNSPYGYIEFHSADEKEAGVGEYADMIILDEAARLPESLFDTLKAIIFSEGAKAFIISTIMWDTPKNWFYQLLLRSEKEKQKVFNNTKYYEEGISILKKVNEKGIEYLRKNKIDIMSQLRDLSYLYRTYVSRRVPLSQVSRMPEHKKKKTIEEVKNNPQRYRTEIMCIFPSEGRLFNYTGLVYYNENNKKYNSIYIGFDPARTYDNAAVVVVGVYEDELNRLKYDVIETYYRTPDDNMTYRDLIDEVSKIYKKYKSKYKTFLAVDSTGIGDVIVEDFQHYSIFVDFPIKYTSGENISREKGRWKVPKNRLVLTVKEMFDNKMVIINGKNKALLNEIDNFKQINKGSSVVYEAEVGHDDLVNAMMIALFSAYEIDKLKYKTNYKQNIYDKKQGITYKQIYDFIQMQEKRKELEKIEKNITNYYSEFIY